MLASRAVVLQASSGLQPGLCRALMMLNIMLLI